MLESGFRGTTTAHWPRHWAHIVRPAPREFTILGKRDRSLSVLLALVLELAFLALWITQTHRDNPWAKSGIPDAQVAIQYIPMMIAKGGGPRTGKSPTHKAPPAQPAPTITPTDTITKFIPKPVPEPPPPPKPQEEAPPPAETPKEKEMSAAEADEFRRQWAAMNNDLQKQALDNAKRDSLKTPEEPRAQRDSEMAKVRERDKPIQTLLAEHGQRTEHTARQDAIDGSIMAGELCVTGSRGTDDVQIALPCVGDNFVTDFGWYARLRAPKRGEPSYRPVDQNGRVFVRQHQFAPATLAAFEEASVELRKIQVTMRMVYLPDLRFPIQLLSRDNNAGAIGAEAFATEGELAAYLRNWAANVRSWSGPHAPAAGPAAAPGDNAPAGTSPPAQ
jgi:outer membrane biosynthesis protein TonB